MQPIVDIEKPPKEEQNIASYIKPFYHESRSLSHAS